MKCGKPSLRLAAHAIAGVFAATAWSAELELVGVMQDPTGSYVALRSVSSRPAVWVRVGGRFGEFVVARFDPDTGTATLTVGVSRVDLALRQSRIQSADTPTASVTRAIARKLHTLTSAAYQHFWDTATTRATTADFVGPDRALFRVESVAGEDYVPLRFALNPDGTVSVVEPSGAPMPSAINAPSHIFVTAGTTLEAVSRRLGVNLAQLVDLNPDFAQDTPTGATRSVRVR